jgi:hypothetical protein
MATTYKYTKSLFFDIQHLPERMTTDEYDI